MAPNYYPPIPEILGEGDCMSAPLEDHGILANNKYHNSLKGFPCPSKYETFSP